MNYGEVFLYFTAGAFWGLVSFVNGHNLWRRYQIKKHGNKSVNDLIEKLKAAAQDAEEKANAPAPSDVVVQSNKKAAGREVHQFQWRHDGKLNKANIIIDPALDTAFTGTREEFEEMVRKGEAGTLEDLMNTVSDHKKELMETTDFVFSAKSVAQMREAGITPDELVAKMLKATGRM